MVELSTKNKALCFEDSTKKPLKLFIYYPVEVGSGVSTHEWHYFTTIENAIILESAEIEEGILDSNKFELGSFVIPQFKVKWNNDGIKYKNLACIPVQQIGDEYIAYFDGYTKTEELSYADNTVTATIVPFIDKVLDIDVSPTLMNWGAPTVAEAIQSALIYGDGITNPNISVDIDKLKIGFANANLPFAAPTQEEIGGKLTVSNFLKMCGEFLGAHIKILGKRKVYIEDIPNYQFMGSYTNPTTHIEFVRIPSVKTAINNKITTLPKGYKKINFLRFTGTQYIDTGIIPSNHEVTVEYTTPYYHSNNHIFGTDANRYYFHFTEYDRRYWIGSDNLEVSGGYWTSAPKKVRFNVGSNHAVYVNDELITSGNNITSNYSLCIGKREITTGVFYIETFKVYDKSASVLVRDMIPCEYTNANGEVAVGMYDIINDKFYENQGSGNFIYQKSEEVYQLPYYTDLIYDKERNVKFDGINVTTKTGVQLYYTQWWNSNPEKWYEIKDNVFLEKLGGITTETITSDREKAIGDISYYLSNVNVYYAELQSVYPQFAEPNDCLICKSKSSRKIPDDYVALEYIEFNDGSYNYIKTPITTIDEDNFEFDISFALLDTNSVVFRWGGFFHGIGEISISLKSQSNRLVLTVFNRDITISNVAPINQKLTLNFKICKNEETNEWEYQYSGTFGGNGSANIYADITTDIWELGNSGELDNAPKCKIYSFSYHQAETIENYVNDTELYPCIRKSDGLIGMVDIITNEFYQVNNQAKCDYEFSDIAVPILSSSASGIHSMIADIRCKATDKK